MTDDPTPRRLQVPPELQFLIEKREQQRRLAQRRASDATLGEQDERSGQERRQSDRRQ